MRTKLNAFEGSTLHIVIWGSTFTVIHSSTVQAQINYTVVLQSTLKLGQYLSMLSEFPKSFSINSTLA